MLNDKQRCINTLTSVIDLVTEAEQFVGDDSIGQLALQNVNDLVKIAQASYSIVDEQAREIGALKITIVKQEEENEHLFDKLTDAARTIAFLKNELALERGGV